jgi:hypothetical protein
MVQVHACAVELVPEVRAAGTGTELEVGAEHDVVGEELRAAVEELGERLLPLRGIELVLLLHRNPGKLAPLLREPPAKLGVLGLEPCQLVASGLPLLPGSDLVLGHRIVLLWVPILGRLQVGKLIASRPATRTVQERGTTSASVAERLSRNATIVPDQTRPP